jgi:hypothetical protein
MASPTVSPSETKSYAADLYPVTAGLLSVEGLVKPLTAVCPVAVCLSGGGSRAMTAAIGQMQAFEALQVNGRSLLSQTKALSSASGGSWFAVPFMYLQVLGDGDFLGSYMTPAELTLSNIDELAPKSIGMQITSEFSIPALAVKALLLYHEKVPADMLWQTLIGLHMLAPYGLYAQVQPPPFTPHSFFSLDAARVQAIEQQTFPGREDQNPSLAKEAWNVVAAHAGQQRPYFVCNTAMTVLAASGATLLAPVQITPLMTGIVGQPDATDVNSMLVGGGGVESFAFSSTPQAVAGKPVPTSVLTNQERQWTLVDAVGSSSAFFAARLAGRIAEWRADPVLFAMDLAVHGPPAVRFLAGYGAFQASSLPNTADLWADLSSIDSIVPRYRYWPVSTPPVGQSLKRSEFADGGSLENTGIAAMLAYSDVSTIITFLNSSTKMEAKGKTIRIDQMIPPLFGMQPFNEKTGTYEPYPGDPELGADFQNNCVFNLGGPSGKNMFLDLLEGLWIASGSNQYNGPAIYKQTLTTVENQWFGVKGGRTVTVLWVYLEYNSAWHSSIKDPLVRAEVDVLKAFKTFPHYSTLDTELDAREINLLANLTAWTIQSNASLFESFFRNKLWPKARPTPMDCV